MKFFWVLAVASGIITPGFADETASIESDVDWRNNFHAGERELTVGGVAYFSPSGSLSRRPTINYAGGFAQLGYMLGDVGDHGLWSGNFEGLVEGFGQTIHRGRGNYMTGGTLLLRYNVVPSHWRLVPYFQAGAGITLTDADRNVLGQTFNFNLNLGLGVRYFVSSNCSVNGEFRYQHISNAGMAERNLGIDAQGGVLSVSWFF